MKTTLHLHDSYAIAYPTPAGALRCELTLLPASRCNGSVPHVHHRDQPTVYARWTLDGQPVQTERLYTVGGVRVWWRSHGSYCLARASAPDPTTDVPTDYLTHWTPPPRVMALLRGYPVTRSERASCTRLRAKLRAAGVSPKF